jgi:mono/diheme cytochrome c family protein
MASRRLLESLRGLLLLTLPTAVAAQSPPVTVVPELERYIGWLTYEQYCSRCHGPAGVGSDFAPALPPRIARMSQAVFLEAMEQGYPGLEGMLGPWSVENPTLRNYYAPLWAYLAARARGELPAGALRYAGAD